MESIIDAYLAGKPLDDIKPNSRYEKVLLELIAKANKNEKKTKSK